MKKYAMMVLGDYDTKHDTAEFVHGEMLTRFVTVRDFEEARETAKKLLAKERPVSNFNPRGLRRPRQQTCPIKSISLQHIYTNIIPLHYIPPSSFIK